MRRTPTRGLKLIKDFEGYSEKPYICPAGYLTVGFGHVVKPNEKELFSNGITEDMALDLLINDVKQAERSVLRFINVDLTDYQYSALVSFTFNLGGGALQRSTLRRKVNREEHSEVPHEFMKWVYADGRKMSGLIRRRQAEAALYSGGDIFSDEDE